MRGINDQYRLQALEEDADQKVIAMNENSKSSIIYCSKIDFIRLLCNSKESMKVTTHSAM